MGDDAPTGEDGDDGVEPMAFDLPPFLLQPAAPSEPEPEDEPPPRRSRLATYAMVAAILVAFAGLNAAMLAEFLAVEAFVTGERVEIACSGDGGCALARSGSWGTFRPAGRFPLEGLVAVDPNCGVAPPSGESCRPGLWLVGWEGPVSELSPSERSFEVDPADRPDDALFVPLAGRGHGGWRGDLTIDDLDRARLRDGPAPWRLRVDTHRFIPFPLVPVLLGVEAVGVAALVTVVARRIARDRRFRRVDG